MKKLCIAFSTKDRTELSMQSIKPLLQPDKFDLWWIDGSKTLEGQELPEQYNHGMHVLSGITGGPDRAIVYALTEMLKQPYDFVGLCENDVLLDDDWFAPTIALFDSPEGLPVGAVTARSFADRILIQRDSYAVLHNAGAGFIIFTREAAQIILDNYRTGWWSENRAVFSRLSGIDIGKFAAFHHNEQFTTGDWSWDTILAAHGLATVALTPSKAGMIGQEISLEQQGLRLTQDEVAERRNEKAFALFLNNLHSIFLDKSLAPVDHLLRTRAGFMLFPHHVEKHGGLFDGKWTTRWNQACGPFVYVAGEGAAFSMPVFGPCAFHVGGGPVSLVDDATGYNIEMDFTGQEQAVTIAVPRDMQTGLIRLTFGPGACLCGIETTHEQAVWKDVTFDYSKLPPVEEKK